MWDAQIGAYRKTVRRRAVQVGLESYIIGVQDRFGSDLCCGIKGGIECCITLAIR